jgi:hypothetical protein
LKNNHCIVKKSLISILIILFVGASFIPSGIGYQGKKSLQIINEKSINFLLNDDFVNAYWNFDECNGNIAYDSSGHSYDGTIHGATWTTDSYSGCALSFDGDNDYVDLNDYAKYYLGFNKTDDLIFSFHFKTSSTDKGIIYSQCRGDSYGYNPGFHIALKSDGRIEVQVWRLNCGILMNSTGNYNDGTWHFTEIYYNGISTNPMVDIYVDGAFDSTYEKYVCSFFSDQFKYAQIGRHSHEEVDYFNGKIDDLKIIKYSGGNEQNPPNINGPKHGLPNFEYNYSFVTEDPEGDNISIVIDWDDGNIEEINGTFLSGEKVIVSHVWDKERSYNITARSKDRWHQSSWSEPYEVVIGNRPPNVTMIAGPKSGDIKEELNYTFVAEDPEGQTLKYFIDWGDTNTEWTNYYMSGEEINVTHAWSNKGDYSITAYAKDDLDDEGPWSEPYIIRIGNQPPSSPQIDGPIEGYPGEKYKFIIVSTDPESDDINYELEWGDGTDEQTEFYKSGETVTISHIWSNQGNFTIKARACDTFGNCSNWSEFPFKVPRSKALNLSELLFERFPNMLQIIRHLIGLKNPI